MKKLKNYIDNAYGFGKLPKDLTLAEYRVLEDVYIDLLLGKESEFISEKVKQILNRCGINTREKGIGWVAYII